MPFFPPFISRIDMTQLQTNVEYLSNKITNRELQSPHFETQLQPQKQQQQPTAISSNIDEPSYIGGIPYISIINGSFKIPYNFKIYSLNNAPSF